MTPCVSFCCLIALFVLYEMAILWIDTVAENGALLVSPEILHRARRFCSLPVENSQALDMGPRPPTPVDVLELTIEHDCGFYSENFNDGKPIWRYLFTRQSEKHRYQDRLGHTLNVHGWLQFVGKYCPRRVTVYLYDRATEGANPFSPGKLKHVNLPPDLTAFDRLYAKAVY